MKGLANYFNIYAALLAFVVSSAIVYGLWDVVNSVLAFFPTPLYIMCSVMWVSMVFGMICFYPFVQLVSDDYGG